LLEYFVIHFHHKFGLVFIIIDNAWMETEAVNMHDETGELTKDLKLEAGKYIFRFLVNSLHI